MGKIGRNQPCPCGSGLKYKKCCEARDKAPVLPAARDRDGALVHREPIEVIHQGKRFRVVGSELHWDDPAKTDHEFYVDFLRKTLGEEWNQAQLGLAPDERHIVHSWNEQWDALRRGETDLEREEHAKKQYSSVATGNLKALMCLAYDLVTLADSMVLPADLVARLRKADQFPGARYEVAVATVFLRAGYAIEWLDTSRSQPEFVATHRITGRKVTVEAKSRHRPGVLGRPGEAPAEVEIDVAHLMKGALKKETDGLPYVICIDLNMPTASPKTFPERVEELSERVLKRFGSGDAGNPDSWAAVLFTNYSWQWDGQRPAGEPMNLAVFPQNSTAPLPHAEARLLAESLFGYGDVTTRSAPTAPASAEESPVRGQA